MQQVGCTPQELAIKQSPNNINWYISSRFNHPAQRKPKQVPCLGALFYQKGRIKIQPLDNSLLNKLIE
jgi:hypothetical protein